MAGTTTTTCAAAARTAVVLLLSLGTSVIEGQSRSNGEIRCCQLSVICCSRRQTEERPSEGLGLDHGRTARMVDILSFGGKTEGGREGGREMRCVQNGRLERKEREREARITTGLSERRGSGSI